MKSDGNSATVRSRSIRVYDFRRPDKFSKEQIRTLEMIHEGMARMLSTSLSAHLRTLVRVHVKGIQQLPFGEFLEQVVDPAVLLVIAMEPLGGRAVMELDPGITYPILDRLLGGDGKTVVERRALTDIETTVVERIWHTMICDALRESWSHLLHLEPSLHSIETNPMFAQIVGPSEMSIQIVFQVALADQEGSLQFCLPFLWLEPVAHQFSARHWFASERPENPAGRLGEALDQVMLDLWVRLGSATLNTRDLLQLEVGDVIPLDRSRQEPLELFVVDRPRFRVRPGRRGRRLAVAVQEIVEVEDGGRQGIAWWRP